MEKPSVSSRILELSGKFLLGVGLLWVGVQMLPGMITSGLESMAGAEALPGTSEAVNETLFAGLSQEAIAHTQSAIQGVMAPA